MSDPTFIQSTISRGEQAWGSIWGNVTKLGDKIQGMADTKIADGKASVGAHLDSYSSKKIDALPDSIPNRMAKKVIGGDTAASSVIDDLVLEKLGKAATQTPGADLAKTLHDTALKESKEGILKAYEAAAKLKPGQATKSLKDSLGKPMSEATQKAYWAWMHEGATLPKHLSGKGPIGWAAKGFEQSGHFVLGAPNFLVKNIAGLFGVSKDAKWLERLAGGTKVLKSSFTRGMGSVLSPVLFPLLLMGIKFAWRVPVIGWLFNGACRGLADTLYGQGAAREIDQLDFNPASWGGLGKLFLQTGLTQGLVTGAMATGPAVGLVAGIAAATGAPVIIPTIAVSMILYVVSQLAVSVGTDLVGKLLGAFGIKMPGAKEEKEVQQNDELKNVERRSNTPGFAKGFSSWLDRTEERQKNMVPESTFKAAS